MVNQEADKLRQEMLDKVAEKAKRDFSDTRFDFLRPLERRRMLVIVSYALVLAYGVLNHFDQPLWVLPTLITWGISLWLLRLSTRGITDYPDELVDERMREVRGLTYRYAFMGCIIFMSVFMIIYIANQLLAKGGSVEYITADQLHDMSFCLFFACMALPSAIYAWNEKLV